MFFGPSAFRLRSKICKKTIPGRSKINKKLVGILIQFLMDLGANLGRFWEGFGGQVGAKLGPNATKTRPQNQSKKISLFGSPPERFWVDFGFQVGRSLGAPNLYFLDFFWFLGTSWAKMAPRALQEALGTNFGTNFNRVLINLWSISG